MLADSQYPAERLGSLGREVEFAATFLQQLLTFITDELPCWRDRPGRKRETSEALLSAQLCAHLNSAARRSKGFDVLQFRQEEPDERTKDRKLDMVAAPCDATIWVDGRRHVDFDTLLPIECKRLPTPAGARRDDREYVFNQHASTGGIQRFKAGHHGAGHRLGAMIGYVQAETCAFWNTRVTEWVNALVLSNQEGWTAKALLRLEQNDEVRHMTVLSSSHARKDELQDIELRHLWVKMN